MLKCLLISDDRETGPQCSCPGLLTGSEICRPQGPHQGPAQCSERNMGCVGGPLCTIGLFENAETICFFSWNDWGSRGHPDTRSVTNHGAEDRDQYYECLSPLFVAIAKHKVIYF